MKKVLLSILCISVLTLSLSGCMFSSDSVVNKLQTAKDEVLSQTQTEEDTPKSTEVKVWPENSKTQDVPRLDNQNISVVLDTDAVASVSYSGVGKEDAMNYLNELKDFGFNQEKTESTTDLNVYYAANKNDGRHLTFDYTLSGILSISINM